MWLHAFGRADSRPGIARIGSLRGAVTWCRVRPAGAATLLVALASPAFSQSAVAQQLAPQPGYDVRQIERQLESQQKERSAQRQPLRMPQLAPTQAQGDRRPWFDLRAVSVTGAHVLPADVIASAYRPYVGRRVSQADLATIAIKIGDLYRDAGFSLSRAIVPPQHIEGGRVQIKVIEGRITQLALEGDDVERYGVRPLLNDLLAERPSRQSTLERKLLLVNSLPGVRIDDSAIEEIGQATGNFRLTVRLKTWRAFTAFSLDNLGSAAVGPWQSFATAALNSAFVPGDVLTANLSTIPTDPRELAFGRLAYDAPIGTDGVRLGGSALYSEVRPGDDRRLVDDVTRTQSYEARASFAPWQSRLSGLTLAATFGFSDVAEHNAFGPVYEDHIRAVGLVADYRLKDDFGGANYLTATLRQGFGILGATRIDDNLSSRGGASGEFTALGFWFTRYQTFSDAWSIKFAAAGQWSPTPLLLSQQFYLGGVAFGRGYDSAVVSGDNGLAGSFELRFDQPLNDRLFKGYELYAFVDSGAVWNAGTALLDGLSLTSAGGGLRVNLAGDLQAGVGLAFPLTYRSPTSPSRDPRVLFSLSSALRLCPRGAWGACS